MLYSPMFLSGRPYPKGSWTPVRTRSGKIKLRPGNPKWVKWYDRARAELERQWTGPKIKEPVKVQLLFLLPRLKTVLRGHPVGKREGDLDKLVRAVLDSMTDVVYNDDCQVVDVSAVKQYSDEEQGVWVTVSTDL